MHLLSKLSKFPGKFAKGITHGGGEDKKEGAETNKETSTEKGRPHFFSFFYVCLAYFYFRGK